jgi:hypothetical protein
MRQRIVLTAVLALVASLAVGTPASAAHNDSFSASTGGGCAVVDFIDYGTWPDGTTHDDYIVVNDYCYDGKGTQGVFSVKHADGSSDIWPVLNRSGYYAPPVYQDVGNVVGGDLMWLSVCMTDGNNLVIACRDSTKRYSVDG